MIITKERGNMCMKAINEKCYYCKKEIIGRPALSRKDNISKICSQCGTMEALINFAGYEIRYAF